MSSKSVKQEAKDQAPPPARRKKRWYGMRVLQMSWSLVFLFVVGIGIAVAVNIDRPVPAPDWVRDQVQAELSKSVPDGSVEIAQLSLVLDSNLHTHILIEDMRLLAQDRGLVGRLADVRIDLLRRALPRGEIKAKKITLSGLQVSLRRDTQGRFNVSFGDQMQMTDGADLGALLNQINGLFDLEVTETVDAITADGLTLRYEDALFEQVFVADGGRISAQQSADGVRLRADVAVLSGGADVTTLEVTYESRAPREDGTSDGGTVGVNLAAAPARLIASQTPALAWMSVLDAPISGAMRFSVDGNGTLGTVFGTLDLAAGSLSPQAGTRPILFDNARSYFSYEPSAQKLIFDEVAVSSDTLTARASGIAYLRDLENGFPQSVIGQFQFDQLAAEPDGYLKNAAEISEAAVDFRLRLDPFTLDVGSAYAVPVVQGVDNPVVRSHGTVAADPSGWRVAMDYSVAQIDTATVLAMWPASLRTKTRDWFVANLQKGMLRDVKMALRTAPDTDPMIDASFEFDDANVRFLPKMPPIEGGAGFATLEGQRFALALEKGVVNAPQGGRVQLAGSHLVIPNLFTPAPATNVSLRAQSTITAALSIIDQEPLNLMTKSNRAVNLADGRADLSVELTLPLADVITTQDVGYVASGILRGVTSKDVVAGRTVKARRLDMRVDTGGMTLSGAAEIGRTPIDFKWAQAFDGSRTSKLTGDVELSERFLDEFGIALPNGAFRGRGTGQLSVDLDAQGGGTFSLGSNLRGVTLSLPDLGWLKPSSQRGDLQVSGRLGKPARIDRVALSGAGLDARGTVKLATNGSLEAATFSRLRLGAWLDAPVTLIGRGAGVTPEVRINGGTVDLRKRKFGGGDSASSGSGGPMRVQLDRLIVSDGITLTALRGDFSTRGAFNGNFRAKVNGGADVRGTIVPGPKGTAFRLRSDDAGGVFRSAKLLRQARGGALDIQLQPTGAAGTYDGALKVENTRVVDAPALASLLNAISVIGLLDQMGSGGILFSDVDASFRLSPTILTLFSSSATGPSIGLSMDGSYRLADGAMDFQGVVSPLYALNGIGQIFTRRGEGLIGFNFTLKGSSRAPRVAVNPLSVLTPGMFREIFRRAPPKRD